MNARTCALAVGLCLAASAASALELTIVSFSDTSLTINLSGSIVGSTPSSATNNLFIEGAGNWMPLASGSTLTVSGPLISGMGTPGAQSSSGGSLGEYINLTLSSGLSTSDTGTGVDVTLSSGVSGAFDWSSLPSLAVYWGYNGEGAAPFGVQQTALTVVPEPSSYGMEAGMLVLLCAGIVRRRKTRR